MAVTKQQKAEILAELVEKFKNAKSIGFAATNTLTVSEFGTLRNELRTVDASYTLAKKTLIKKALKDAIGVEVGLEMLQGQIGVVCSNDDAIAGLSKVNDLVKSTKGEKISWAASIIDGELKELEETKVIAGMPSRDTLLGRLVGSMKSPVSALARFLDAAKIELETQGKESVGQLESDAPAADAPKAEEKKEEAPAEEEKKEEVKTEEAAPVEEAPAPEAKEEDKKEETA
jgi:large subunit ribosomal protein L10